MITVDEIRDGYFEWMCDAVCGQRFSQRTSFRKLLRRLHDTEFRYLIARDENRAADGVNLRYRFAVRNNVDHDFLDGPCSVLEMMVALSIICEKTIMDNPHIGNRTGQWFWSMISSLGLSSMMDDRYDENYVDYVLERFMNREYKPDGEGGLFTIRNYDRDLRKAEIWYQLCWYLDNFV